MEGAQLHLVAGGSPQSPRDKSFHRKVPEVFKVTVFRFHCHFFFLFFLKSLSPTLCNPVDCIAHKAPQSMGFSRKEYWSGLPFPSPGDLPDPGIKPRSPALQSDALTSEPRGKPSTVIVYSTCLLFQQRVIGCGSLGKNWNLSGLQLCHLWSGIILKKCILRVIFLQGA